MSLPDSKTWIQGNILLHSAFLLSWFCANYLKSKVINELMWCSIQWVSFVVALKICAESPQVCWLWTSFISVLFKFLFFFSLLCSLPTQDYCASKFGAVGFHESLSHELKAAEKDGIKTTLVCPYLVDTGMFRGCRIRWVEFSCSVLIVSYKYLEVTQLLP